MIEGRNSSFKFQIARFMTEHFENNKGKYFSVSDILSSFDGTTKEDKTYKSKDSTVRALIIEIEKDFEEHGLSIDDFRIKKGKSALYGYPNNIGFYPLEKWLEGKSKPLKRDREEFLKDLILRSSGLLPNCMLETRNGILRNPSYYISFEHNECYKNHDMIADLFVYIEEKRVIEFHFSPYDAPARKVILSPYFLKEYNQRWFLFGFEHDRKKYNKSFPLDRISNLIPAEDSDIEYKKKPKDIDYTTFFDDIVGVTHELNNGKTNPEWKIKIKTRDKKVHGLIMSKPLMNKGRQKEIQVWDNNKGYGLIEIDACWNIELMTNLLHYSDGIQVVSPKEAVTIMRNKINKMFKLYN